jgi:hypothetical protein
MDGDWTLLIEDQDLSDDDRPHTFRDGQIWQAPHPDPIGTYEMVDGELLLSFLGTPGCFPWRPGKLRTWSPVPISAETTFLAAFPVVEPEARSPANNNEGMDEDDEEDEDFEAIFSTWGGDHLSLFREGEGTEAIRSEIRARAAREQMRVVAAG